LARASPFRSNFGCNDVGLGVASFRYFFRDDKGHTTTTSSSCTQDSTDLAQPSQHPYNCNNYTVHTVQTANMVYVRQEKLPNLRLYKYSGVDHSLVSKYILKPFYTNFVIKCFPMWMAPNLITLSGFGFVVLNMITLLWYCPSLDQDCPPWVYASWAVGLFLYQTFDAVDGTQA
jgi:hypothetical protein